MPPPPPKPPIQPGVWVLTAVNARCPFGGPPASLIQRTPGRSSVSLTQVQGSLNGGQESVAEGPQFSAAPSRLFQPLRHHPGVRPTTLLLLQGVLRLSQGPFRIPDTRFLHSLTHFNQFRAMMMMINDPLPSSSSAKSLCPRHSTARPKEGPMPLPGTPWETVCLRIQSVLGFQVAKWRLREVRPLAQEQS